MKLFTGALVCIILCCCTSIKAQSKDSATVCFLRNVGWYNNFGAISVFVDSAFQCKLDEKRYFYRTFPTGVHKFSLQWSSKKLNKKIEQISIDMKGGETYYLQPAITSGVLVEYMYLEEVTKNTANLMLPRLKQDRSCMNQ